MLDIKGAAIVALAFLCFTSCLAQDAAAPGSASTPPTRTFVQRGELAEAYRFAPGDVVSVKVMNFPELSAAPPVQPDGAITLPLIGSIKVSGRTAAEVQQDISSRLAEYIKQPAVIITVDQFHTPTVWVLGQVASPQPVRYQTGFTINDYISAAGGATDIADISRVTINRTDKTSATVDLSPRAEASATPVEVKENDLIVVPEQKGNLSVLGKVVKPGAFPFRRGMTISDAMTMAGGALEDADPSRVQIMGQGKTLTVDYQAFIESARKDQNVDLQPGDVVFVPESEKKVHIYGAVQKPGVYKFRENETVMSLILRSGGLGADASPSAAALVHATGESSKPEKLDLTRFMKSGDSASNPLLMPSDIVYVPEKGREKQTWSSLSQMSMAVLSLFNIFGWR